jgi:hypothetical protein
MDSIHRDDLVGVMTALGEIEQHLDLIHCAMMDIGDTAVATWLWSEIKERSPGDEKSDQMVALYNATVDSILRRNLSQHGVKVKTGGTDATTTRLGADSSGRV